jgi:hypothetical protein
MMRQQRLLDASLKHAGMTLKASSVFWMPA